VRDQLGALTNHLDALGSLTENPYRFRVQAERADDLGPGPNEVDHLRALAKELDHLGALADQLDELGALPEHFDDARLLLDNEDVGLGERSEPGGRRDREGGGEEEPEKGVGDKASHDVSSLVAVPMTTG
jgi:hypothetical protein